MQIFSAVIIMLILGCVVGLLLGIASEKLAVKVDERLEKLVTMLPGYNCGGCGNPGCQGMAEKLLSGDCTIDQCRPCKAEQREVIAAYLKENA